MSLYGEGGLEEKRDHRSTERRISDYATVQSLCANVAAGLCILKKKIRESENLIIFCLGCHVDTSESFLSVRHREKDVTHLKDAARVSSDEQHGKYLISYK